MTVSDRRMQCPRAMQRSRVSSADLLALLIFLSLFALAACRQDRLDPLEGMFSVTPEEVTWARVFVEHPARRTVTVENPSRVSLSVGASTHLEGEGAHFTVLPERFELPAGAQVELELRVVAHVPGTFEGTLRVEADGRVKEIPLRAVAEAEPTCAAFSPCHAGAFDPALGECVSEPLPDGSACLSAPACLEDARCFAGGCVGAPVHCDDGNPCTTDACSDEGGCVHLAEAPATVCGASNDPCRAPVCDPVTGCGLVDVPDGTSCGEADCATAAVCLSGQCREVPVPEGAACGAGSPCRAAGRCIDGTCEQPPGNALIPVWEHVVPGTVSLVFDGVADAGENLYWAECPFHCMVTPCPPCVTVSATRDGVIRWRMPAGTLVGGSRDLVQRQMVVGDAVVSFLGTGVVLAQRTSDGRVLWHRDLRVDHGNTLFGETVPEQARQYLLGAAGVDAGGRILVPLTGQSGVQNAVQHHGQLVVALNPATGVTEWVTPVQGRFGKVASGRTGDAIVATENAPAEPPGHRLQSLTGAGGIRWVSESPASEYLALWNRVLVTGSAHAADAVSGAPLWSHGGLPAVPGLLGEGSSFNVHWRPGAGVHDILRRDLRTGALQWSMQMPMVEGLSDLMLTEGGGPLFLRMLGDFAATHEVVQLSPQGSEEWACTLPPFTSWGTTALLDGRLVAKFAGGQGTGLAAYDLPGTKLAREGWVIHRGSLARDGRAR